MRDIDGIAVGPKAVDLRNKAFGRLTVIRLARKRWGKLSWDCLCQCGNLTEVLAQCLVRGETQSCGCLHREWLANRNRTHGQRHNRLYRVWASMLDRCRLKTSKSFKDYGGRGVSVCQRWHDFANFYEDMGEPPTPKHTLDRKDNNGNYEPDNCRWATRVEQSRNTRSNVSIEFNGERMCLEDWARKLGISGDSLAWRISRWGVERAMTTAKINRRAGGV